MKLYCAACNPERLMIQLGIRKLYGADYVLWECKGCGHRLYHSIEDKVSEPKDTDEEAEPDEEATEPSKVEEAKQEVEDVKPVQHLKDVLP